MSISPFPSGLDSADLVYRYGGPLLSPRHAMVVLALAAFFAGPRTPYFVFEVGSVAMFFVCAFAIGPRYWGKV